MLAYLQPLCNGLPVCPTPVRRRPAAASRRLWDHPRWVARLWRMLDLVSPADLQRSLYATRAYPGPHPIIPLCACTLPCRAPLHVSGGPSRLSAYAISTASTRRHPPHVFATEAVRRGAP